jgi:SH3-like domain-containing protein
MWAAALMLGLMFFPLSQATANPSVPEDKEDAAMTLPRFGTLRFDAVNLRRGPGARYLIDWVYRQAGLPVEALERFDHWLKIKDYEGTEGWVHKSQLRWQRRGIMLGTAPQPLYAEPQLQSKIAAQLMPRVMFDIKECSAGWCAVKSDNFSGFLQQKTFFGSYAGEVIK